MGTNPFRDERSIMFASLLASYAGFFYHCVLKEMFHYTLKAFYAVVSWIHGATGWILPYPTTWTTIFSSISTCEDLSIVVRVVADVSWPRRLQGFVQVQQCGKIFRLVLEGYEVVDDEDEVGRMDARQGQFKKAAIYLPDSIQWNFTSKKVKGWNTASIRGRVVCIAFPRNDTGISMLQVSMMRNRRESKAAKAASLALEEALLKAQSVTSGH